MSRKQPQPDVFQQKISRNDRFAQMSHQEKVIEQKKKEILAKLEAKQKAKSETGKGKEDDGKKDNASAEPKKELKNIFSNDGSFLEQFRQLKDKKLETDLKGKDSKEDKPKFHRWTPKRRSPSPKERQRQTPRTFSRFSSEKVINFDPKITMSTSFQTNFTPQEVTGQPLLKNNITFTEIVQQPTETVIAPQVLIDVPPPQIVQSNTALVLTETPQNVLVTTSLQPIITTVSLPPPCLPTVELASIPPPNPIQVQNIPQPEPLNALNIPQPAPIQVQNIPTPTSIQLNEIPNPKPLDLLAIPTPSDNEPKLPDQFMPKNVIIHNQPIQPVPPPAAGQLQTFTVVQVSSPPSIPSLMAQPILPPPGMGLNVNVNCPPPTSFMPPVNVPPPPVTVFPPGSAEYESMASLGRMVAKCGDTIEDMVRQRKNQDPNLWFLFHKDSAAYHQYRQLIEQFKRENEEEEKANEIKKDEMYEPESVLDEIKTEIKEEFEENNTERKRKRKSRWGDKDTTLAPPAVLVFNQQQQQNQNVMLSKVTRTDPGLVQYAINTYGSAILTEEVWKKAEDNYKINILYQDMVKKREEAECLLNTGKNKYEYDSDEDTEGGTWEHKAREKEMVATQLWAQELTRQAEGKHHIGDFLPPEELKRFMEQTSATKEGRQPSFSDYKEFKIKEDNIGFKMLQKLGWTEGQGLGSGGNGIIEPVNKAPPREHTQGLGLNQVESDEDEYESYRKRMMLAYRFRPNPLNNPRRPYY